MGPLIKVEKVKKKKEIEKQETVCLANGLEVSKFENFKKGSEFLKEPLASELKNESDHFTNDAVQLLKFHGSYQQDNRENRKPGQGKDWQMMLRLRSPGGEISGSEQHCWFMFSCPCYSKRSSSLHVQLSSLSCFVWEPQPHQHSLLHHGQDIRCHLRRFEGV